MDYHDKIRKNIKYGNDPHGPVTKGQKEEAKKRGINPETYRDDKLEMTDVIRDTENGNMGKVRNNIRTQEKWDEDGF